MLPSERLASLPYRPGVGIMLLNKENQVFVAKRIDMQIGEAWQMPQGGMDEGENPRETAFREMEEEIGTTKAEVIAESHDWLHYDLPEELVSVVWKGKYRGQRQKWFLMRFTGSDADINIATPHPEFNEWKGAPHAELPNLIVPFKQQLYRDILKEFALYL